MLGQHNKTFAAETEERLRLEVLRHRDEFPADVRIALSADSNLPGVSREPGELSRSPVDHFDGSVCGLVNG